MSVLCDLDYVCDIVDNFVCDDRATAPSQFWKQIHNNPEAQQVYVQCLVFKYISFTLGFGHKPLREAMRMIKNVSSFPGQNTARQSIDISGQAPAGNRGPIPRHSSLLTLGVSPPKRTRSNTVPNRRPSVEASGKSSPRGSVDKQPGHSPHDKNRRKTSDTQAEAGSLLMLNSAEDRRVMQKLRDLMYTVSFMLHTCDMSRWDFSNLREVFLIWNKARGWDQDPKHFEATVMKKFSCPPEKREPDQKWKRMFSENLNYYLEACTQNRKTLDDKKVGESTKYWVLCQEMFQNSRHVRLIADALCEQIDKVYALGEESKILPLLHIICDTVISVPFVPVESLEKVYASLQMFYLWAKPVSAAVKEVLDLIQTEMKSPGYFARSIFCQEQDFDLSRASEANLATNSSPMNVMIDSDMELYDAVADIVETIAFESDVKNKQASDYHRILVEQMFHAVFGPESCDLKALRCALKSCPAASLANVCTEALGVMEQSITMETHSGAQDFVRSQLESLAAQLVEETDAKLSDEANANNCEEDDDRPTSVFLDQRNQGMVTSSSAGSLRSIDSGGAGSVVNPPRNQSYLSRTTSGTSLKSATFAPAQGNPEQREEFECYAATTMQNSPLTVKSYEHNNLTETLYQVVRGTAKEYFVEKRKSGSFTSTRKSYISSRQRMSDPRDSGLIEDLAEQVEAHVSKSKKTSRALRDSPAFDNQSNSEKAGQSSNEGGSDVSHVESEKLWREFLERGFDESGDGSDIELLLRDMELEETPTKSSAFLEFKPSPDHTPQAVRTTPLSLADHAPKSPPMESDVAEALDTLSVSLNEQDEMMEPESRRSGRRKDAKGKKKNRFKTIRMKGKKLVRGAVRRTTSMRSLGPDHEERDTGGEDSTTTSPRVDEDAKSLMSTASSSSSSTPPSAAAAFFEAVSIPRWRTVSDPLKSKKNRASARGSKYVHLSSLFHHRNADQADATASTAAVAEPHQLSMSQSFLYPAAVSQQSGGSDGDPSGAPKSIDGPMSLSVPRKFVFSLSSSADGAHPESTPKRKRLFGRVNSEGAKSLRDDEEARNRMDSGIVLDKPSDRPRYRRVASLGQGTNWEENGVAGVKISRKLAVRKNRKSRSSLSYLPERSLRKKVLKVTFVGNDKTVGNLARAYYELRRRQLTRAPLLNHVDLRIFYIPIGENSYEDERVDYPAEPSSFDLQIGEMMSNADPWYQSTVMMTFNNLMRICPKNIESDDEAAGKNETPTPNAAMKPATIFANSLTKFSRFAVTTYHVPLFKANMRTSSEVLINVVFCCGVEIGSVAYKNAIMEGRFGKLADPSDGPPEIFTSFEYAKFGINGSFKSSTKLEAKFYRSVSLVPVGLTNSNNKEQAVYAGADSIEATLVANDKFAKSVKKLRRGQSEDDCFESLGNKLYMSAAKMEIERPQEGTFTVWIDQTLMYTDIKSIEVSRCLAPEHERSHAPKRRHNRGPPRFVSLPLKTFWPTSNPSS